MRGGVVAGFVSPACPDHAQPGAGEDAHGVGMTLAPGTRVVVDHGGPVAAVPAVIGEGHQGLPSTPVDRVPEVDRAMFAGFLGDRCGAGLGGRLRATGGAFQHRADLTDNLAEVDGPDPGQSGDQLGPGVGVDRLGDGGIQLADGGAQGPHQPHLDVDQPGNHLLAQPGGGNRGGAQSLDQHAAGPFTGVAVALAERLQLSGGQPACGLGRGVTVQEAQGDVGIQTGEYCLAARPVLIQQRGELVDRRDTGFDVVGALAGQRLQLQCLGQSGRQRPQLVAVGAQVVGQLERVAGVAFGSGRTPAGADGVECVGVYGNHGVTGGQQSVHDQSPGGLDGHGQAGWVAMAAQPGQRAGDPSLGVGQRPAVGPRPGLVDHGHIVRPGGPVPSRERARGAPSLTVKDPLGHEDARRKLINRPSTRSGHVPKAGKAASARRGWQYSQRPSSGSRTRPCTQRDRVVTTLSVRAAEGMVA